MIEIFGNIFEQDDADAICITTNGVVNKYGEAVMGRGVARQAKELWPELPRMLAEDLIKTGNQVYLYWPPSFWSENNSKPYDIITFPTKHKWQEKADVQLILRSLKQLIHIIHQNRYEKVVLPRPGCSNGGLDWDRIVKPAIKQHFKYLGKEKMQDYIYFITQGDINGK